jgi:hypothetical protein
MDAVPFSKDETALTRTVQIRCTGTPAKGDIRAALRVLNDGMLSRIIRLDFTPVEMLSWLPLSDCWRLGIAVLVR